ncbi:hypothetical protein OAK49_03455 [Euryarchaeota archaeon]|nr:hypothetical protein [Euryarchaeota archaeon]
MSNFSDMFAGGSNSNVTVEEILNDPEKLIDELKKMSSEINVERSRNGDGTLVGDALEDLVFQKTADRHDMDVNELRHHAERAVEEVSRKSAPQKKAGIAGGQAKRTLLVEARNENPLPMFGEIIDNILDNLEAHVYYESIDGEMKPAEDSPRNYEMRDEFNIEIAFLRDPNEHKSGIRIREDTGGILEHNADKLFQTKAETKQLQDSSTGVFNIGLKRALPHLGLWHVIDTWAFGDESDVDNYVGASWKAGDLAEPSGEDPKSNDQQEYWHELNTYWGTPQSSGVGKPGTNWCTKKGDVEAPGSGKTEFFIRRLTDKGRLFLDDEAEFRELIQFVRVVWGRKVRKQIKEEWEVDLTISFEHPSLEHTSKVHISTKESDDDWGENDEILTFIDYTDYDWFASKVLHIKGISPVRHQYQYQAENGDLIRVTLITGIPENHRARFTDDKLHSFTGEVGEKEPYPGFYFWGNGRLFHRAYQPNMEEFKIGTTYQFDSASTRITPRKVDLSKSQSGYLVGFIIFEGRAAGIPFSGPIKWSVVEGHRQTREAIKKCMMMSGAGTYLVSLVAGFWDGQEGVREGLVGERTELLTAASGENDGGAADNAGGDDGGTADNAVQGTGEEE